MGGVRVLGDITQPNVVSRFQSLAVAVEALLDVTVHLEGEKLFEGTLLAKIVANGKFRAYAEADVNVAFNAGNVDFTLEDQADGHLKMKHFRVGDVIEGVDDTALGTIATFNPVTGVGTLTANSANAYAIGLAVRVSNADLKLSAGDGRILKSELLMSDLDEPVAAYVEGFFTDTRVIGLTADAKTELGSKSYVPGETRLI